MTVAATITALRPTDPDVHPGWCINADAPADHCGDHLSDPAVIPATAGHYRLDDDGVAFPRLEVATVETARGVAGVSVTVHDPTRGELLWVDASLTPAEARALIAAVEAELARVDAVDERRVAA